MNRTIKHITLAAIAAFVCSAHAQSAIDVGTQNTAGDGDIVIGNQVDASGTGTSILMGNNASGGSSIGDVGIGDSVTATGNDGTCVGNDCSVLGAFGTATGAKAYIGLEAAYATVSGAYASATGAFDTSLGAYSSTTGTNSVALGYGSTDGGRSDTVSVGSVGNERTISNVAPGTEGTDAVNLNQLNAAYGSLNDRINSVDQSARRGIASVAALANVVAPYRPGSVVLTAGTAIYRGTGAFSMGASRWSSSGRWNVNLGVSSAGSNSTVVRAGVAFVLR